jgi:PilZ domain
MSADADTPSPEAPPEARVAKRRRTLKAGVIAFNDHFMTHNCTVREISETGARLRLDDVMSIPNHFDLLIELDALEYTCEAVWRRQGEIGVRFQGAPRQRAKTRAQVINTVPLAGQKPSLRRKP